MDTSRRKIYILPNLITTTSLALAILAIIRAIHGDFQTALIFILICTVLDMLDGQVARLTNSESQFGAEYDSLADAIAFGVAPALIIYLWVFEAQLAGGTDGFWIWSKIGIPACLFYSITAVLRLVRFNVQSGLLDRHVFRGFPSPASAILLMSFLWLLIDGGYAAADHTVFLLIILIGAGILMVSNLSFYSLKNVSFKSRMPFITLFAVVVLFAILAIDMPLFLFIAAMLYMVSGPLSWLLRWLKRGRTQPLDD